MITQPVHGLFGRPDLVKNHQKMSEISCGGTLSSKVGSSSKPLSQRHNGIDLQLIGGLEQSYCVIKHQSPLLTISYKYLLLMLLFANYFLLNPTAMSTSKSQKERRSLRKSTGEKVENAENGYQEGELPIQGATSNHVQHGGLLGAPKLSVIFEPGNYGIARNLMAYLSQSDVEKLKMATEKFDQQFHKNLHCTPPPKWRCEQWSYHPHSTLLGPCCPTNEVRPCDGTGLGLNGWDHWSGSVIESDCHDPNFSVCTECSKVGMRHCLLDLSRSDNRFISAPVHRLVKRHKEMESSIKLSLCRCCWRNYFNQAFKRELEEGARNLADRGYENASIEEVLQHGFTEMGSQE